MNYRLLLLHIILLLHTADLCRAQQHALRNFSTKDYLAGTQNWDIAQGTDDRIYFGNNYGLISYDGYKWDMRQVKNYTSVRSVLVDKESGHIYVGASMEFGYFRYAPDKWDMEYVSLSDLLTKKDRDFTEVWNVHDWNGRKVFQSHYAVFIAKDDKTVTTRHMKNRIETSAIVGGKLIVMTREKMMLTTPDGKTREVTLPEGLSGKSIRQIIPYAGNILVCTAHDGLFLYDGTAFTPFHTAIDEYFIRSQAFSIAEKDGIMAIGTVRSGLFLYNTKTGEAEHISVAYGLQNNTVLAVNFDDNGNIWLGLDNGIAFIEHHSAYTQILRANESIGTGYASITYGDALYLGTNQGLYTMPCPQGNRILGSPETVSGINGQVWHLTIDEGRLLCSTDDGAYTVNGNKAQKIPATDGTLCICPLRKHPGYFIASDYKGLCVFRRNGNSYTLHSRLSNCPIVSNNIMESADGSVWVSHWQKGVYRITLDESVTTATAISLFNKANGLYVDQGNDIALINGRIYISTVDGFYHYDSNTQKLKKDDTLSALFASYGSALKIHQNSKGDIWAVKQGFMALARKNKNNGYSVDRTSFRSIADNLQFSLGIVCDLDNRYTVFNSNGGFIIVDNEYSNHKESNKVYIRSIIGINANDTILYSQYSDAKQQQLKINHNQNSLRIEFVMPEHRTANGVTYSCMLENYDHDWSAEQRACYKEYTHLSKGHYIFHVKAVNTVNGCIDESTIEFDIMPAWYETTLAHLIYLLLVCLCLYAVYQLIQQRNRRMMEEQRRQQELEIEELRRQHLEMELKHKSTELASSNIDLVHKNDMLQELDAEMSRLSEDVRREESKKNITRKISDIRKGIQNTINDENNQKKFEESFNIIYDNLIKRLCEQYPTLKTSDRKLCAYLRMGLSSKEIAERMNTSTRSIETARYRLRKKLNLQAGDNLTNFIQNF